MIKSPSIRFEAFPSIAGLSYTRSTWPSSGLAAFGEAQHDSMDAATWQSALPLPILHFQATTRDNPH
jgi:hypothetical protein